MREKKTENKGNNGKRKEQKLRKNEREKAESQS